MPERWHRIACRARGDQVKVDDVAEASGTIGYELMCALARRVPVVIVPPGASSEQPTLRTGSYGR